MPVIGRDTGEMRRLLRRHEPLRRAVVGFADAADLAAAPRLGGDPFDHFIEVAPFARIEEAIVAAGTAGAAHVEPYIGIALFEIPMDRPGLTPQEALGIGQIVIVEAIGRNAEQRWKQSGACRQMQADGQLHAVAHFDKKITLNSHCAPSQD